MYSYTYSDINDFLQQKANIGIIYDIKILYLSVMSHFQLILFEKITYFYINVMKRI